MRMLKNVVMYTNSVYCAPCRTMKKRMEDEGLKVARVFDVMEQEGAVKATVNRIRSFPTFVNTVTHEVIPNALSLQALIQFNKVS